MAVDKIDGGGPGEGSWKISCMAGRSGLSARSGRPARFTHRPAARNQTSPALGISARRMQRAAVVLPDPDSPTNPSVSPGRTSKLRSFTARIVPTIVLRKPRRRT